MAPLTLEEHVGTVSPGDPGRWIARCGCGWFGPVRLVRVHCTYDLKAHRRTGA